jgi:hypothetical protein
VAADVNSVLFYITFGLAMYFIYLFAKSFHTVLGYIEKTGKKAYSPYARHLQETRNKKIDKMDKYIREKEKQEKEKKKERRVEKTKEPAEKMVSSRTLKPIKEEEYYVYDEKKKEE